MDITFYMAWGAGGAFVYGGLHALVAFYEASLAGTPRLRPVLELGVAMTTGVIGAAGVGPVVADMLHRTAVNEQRALAVLIGLVANPLSPLLVNVLSDQVLRRLGAPIRRSRT